MQEKDSDRVTVYIDAFNLYYGMRACYGRAFLWLDVAKLARSLTLATQSVTAVKYFTARIRAPYPDDDGARAKEREASRRRQSQYIDVLERYCNVEVIEGHYLLKNKQCRSCKSRWHDAEEKMTDVNIATSLLTDAFFNKFDTAIVVSGDSDLTPPIEAIRSTVAPQKRVVVAFPSPQRKSTRLKQAAHTSFVISKKKLRLAQLPTSVPVSETVAIVRPASWS